MTAWKVIEGDCVETMAAMPASSVDAIVTDPPYGLGFMGKDWDSPGGLGDMPMRRNHAMNTVNTGVTRQGGRQRSCEDFAKRQARDARSFGAWSEQWARQALRVLKPGGHLLAFGGTRTYHRLACAIEDAGFEIRDTIAYMYGSGFPKSLNLDRLRGEDFCGCDGEPPTEHDVRAVLGADVPEAVGVEGGEGALLLQGMSEPRAPLAGSTRSELAAAGTGELGMEGWRDDAPVEGQPQGREVRSLPGVGSADGASGRLCDGASADDGDALRLPADADGSGASSRPRLAQQRAAKSGDVAGQPDAQAGRAWPTCGRCGLPVVPSGLGTALKPAHEPIVVARKPLSGTVAQTVLEHGTGALNVDGCRIGTDAGWSYPNGRGGSEPHHMQRGERNGRADEPTEAQGGRWPANVVLDPEAAAVLDEQTGELPAGVAINRNRQPGTMSSWMGTRASQVGDDVGYGDSGGASRFFYVAKASSAERNAGLDGFEASGRTDDGYGSIQTPKLDRAAPRENWTPHEVRNSHPTVKPIALMRWLVRLVTPPGGLVLDPFNGSGTTGCACMLEGFRYVGLEREAEYAAIARARIAWWAEHPDGMELVDRLEHERERKAIADSGQIGLFEC